MMMVNAKLTSLSLLVVDDDDDFVDFVAFALMSNPSKSSFSRVSNGEEALRYLRNEGEYVDADVPDIVLLDLNIPRKNGHDVLRDMRGDPDMSAIPVV
ncbi:MAG: response regulator, partial [Planctomycetota bacterium]